MSDVLKQIRSRAAELEEQLAVATNRVSESAIKGQMLAISHSLAQSEKALSQKTAEEETDSEDKNPAFQILQGLSRRRILSKIQGLCPIQVKRLDTELSIRYLDN